MTRGCLIPLFLLACGGDETTKSDASDTAAEIETDATVGDTTGDAADVGDTAGDAADGSEDVAVDTVADTTDDSAIDTTLPDGFPTLCRANRLDECDYLAAETYSVTKTRYDDLEYTDVLGHARLVDVLVYQPDAEGPRPVVLASHGGNHGQTDPARSVPELARHLAAAGYVVVAMTHTGRSPDDQAALCAALEVPTDIVCNVTTNWDIPHDTTRVLDWLEAPPAELDGRLDLALVAHVGQAEGAGAVLMELGATRNFRCPPTVTNGAPSEACPIEGLVSLREPRIDLGIVLSTPGPGQGGFLVQSYGNVRAPLLMLSGSSDTAGGGPTAALSLWPLLPAGGKFKLYLDHTGATSQAIANDLDQCSLAGTTCDDLRLSIESATLAFLDGFVGDEVLARAWLASNDVAILSHGLAVWDRK